MLTSINKTYFHHIPLHSTARASVVRLHLELSYLGSKCGAYIETILIEAIYIPYTNLPPFIEAILLLQIMYQFRTNQISLYKLVLLMCLN